MDGRDSIGPRHRTLLVADFVDREDLWRCSGATLLLVFRHQVVECIKPRQQGARENFPSLLGEGVRRMYALSL